MAINYQDLKTELLAGHPETGAYSANNKTAADELNAINRDGNGGIDGMVEYLATNRFRTNEGVDTVSSALLGRLQTVAESDPFSDPFFRSPHWVAGGTGTNEQIDLNATGNTITFGSAHDISALNANDRVTILGSSQDDSSQQIVSISLQVVTVPNINYTEQLVRAARVYEVMDARIVATPQRDAAKMFLSVLLQSSLAAIDFDDTEMANAFTLMEDAGVWGSADTTALKGLSVDTISRASELGFSFIREGDVEYARTL